MIKEHQNLPYFDWDKYENWNGGYNLKENTRVKSKNHGCKIYCHESYATEMLSVFEYQDTFISKDLTKGQVLTVSKLIPLGEGIVSVELFGGINLNVDMHREKRFIQVFSFASIEEFEKFISVKETHDELIAKGLKAYVVEGGHNPRISLMQGFSAKVKEEMLKQIKHPKQAYVAKIISANKGGYFVDILGVNAFMPGSLAAPNKIIDFRSMVGKEVIVMVEDYNTAEDSFIVSHKKYIEFVLPMKLRTLDVNIKHQGTVTGTSKYGIFVEFGELFTGLLHVSKMSEKTKEMYDKREFKPGMEFEFYIDEITKDNRVILSEESPEDKMKRMTEYVETHKNELVEAKVTNSTYSGLSVLVEDFSGVIQLKEIKKYKLSTRNVNKGDIIKCIIDSIEDGKIVLRLDIKE